MSDEELAAEQELENEVDGDEEDVEEAAPLRFKMFESYPRYGMLKNLLFDDDTRAFGDVEPGDHVETVPYM
jgi:hypothetical protein